MYFLGAMQGYRQGEAHVRSQFVLEHAPPPPPPSPPSPPALDIRGDIQRPGT